MALDLIHCRLSLRESNATFGEQKATLNERKSQFEYHWPACSRLAGWPVIDIMGSGCRQAIDNTKSF